MSAPTKAELIKAAEIEEAIGKHATFANCHIAWPARERAEVLRRLARAALAPKEKDDADYPDLRMV